MNVLLTGATGFIGRRLASALQAAGHDVTGVSRRPPERAASVKHVCLDFARATDPADWRPHVAGIDVVINAVGLFREHGRQTFDAVHTRAAQALFDACAQAGVRRVIQISALGADDAAHSRYHLSKKAADDHLARLDLDWAIVQPSLVYGRGGASAALFNRLAAFPVIPLPGGGAQRVQPVHVEDVVQAIVALLASPAPVRARIALVGPAPLPLRDWLLQLRAALGLPSTRVVWVPRRLARLAARVLERLPRALITTEALDMLERGNTAIAEAMTALLGRPPRPVGEFLTPEDAPLARRAAQWSWLRALLIASIGLVWLWSGVVSLGLFPVEQSYALLARLGATGPVAAFLLYGAATLDLALGVATFALRRRAWLWRFQIALIVGYSAIIAWALPEFWLHPFGPLVKNLPILAGLFILLTTEDEWTTW